WYHTHGNGGFGHNGDCFGTVEYSMGRYYSLTTQFAPNGSTANLRLYYNNLDYNNYESAIVAYVSGVFPPHPNYGMCYGYPNGPGTLVISRSESTDLTAINTVPP